MDVWEHAYITEYGLDRMGYIDAFLQNVNWDIVTNRYETKEAQTSKEKVYIDQKLK
jgi:superoxide dismutase, Fe-Mn family